MSPLSGMARTVTLSLSPSQLQRLDQEGELRRLVARRAGLHPDAVQAVRLLRRSLDARGKRVRWQLQVRMWLQGEVVEPEPELRRAPLPGVEGGAAPVAVVGAGPAGLFAALTLARARVPVILLERGLPVRQRRRDLAPLHRGEHVHPDSNYCFGEGGAGTFSDGKLHTRSGSRAAVQGILGVLVAHGAPTDILVEARPHVGSNRLPQVVEALRETLVEGGVDYRFETRVMDLLVEPGPHLVGLRVITPRGEEEVRARRVILAAGQNAREFHEILLRHQVSLEAKAFAMGLRVEHPQALLDGIQYGSGQRERWDLPAASYAVTAEASGRGVYSFCTCPGGWIVPAMTRAGELVVNGMSLSRRDSPHINSGLVVGVTPEDLVGEAGRRWGVADLGLPVPEDLTAAGPLVGRRVQQALEERAWLLGGGRLRAPAQLLQDYLEGRASRDLPECSYRPGLTAAPLAAVLPPGLHLRLQEGLRRFGHTLRGYLHPEAVLLGVESRTSSPVRIPRDRSTLEAPGLPGLYPAGEGAGHAGGIVSAALDGERVARACLEALGR